MRAEVAAQIVRAEPERVDMGTRCKLVGVVKALRRLDHGEHGEVHGRSEVDRREGSLRDDECVEREAREARAQ